jgi:hypothetical protein
MYEPQEGDPLDLAAIEAAAEEFPGRGFFGLPRGPTSSGQGCQLAESERGQETVATP